MTSNIFVRRDHLWFVKGKFFVGQKAFILRKNGEERIVLIEKIVGNEDGYDLAEFEELGMLRGTGRTVYFPAIKGDVVPFTREEIAAIVNRDREADDYYD